MTLDQRPVAMTLAILAAIAATQVHAPILRIATALSRGLVFTTNAFTHTTQPASRTHAANGNVRKSQGSNRLENVLKKSSTRSKLRKLGQQAVQRAIGPERSEERRVGKEWRSRGEQ